MKSWEHHRRITLMLLLGLLTLLSVATLLFKPRTAAMAQTAPAPAFTVRSYGGKCLDFGKLSKLPIVTGFGGAPVVIADCNGSTAQQVRIEELTDRPGHLVILRAGSGVIGKKQE